MLLCLDCGNTRLKWGLRAQGGWQAQGALALGEIARLPQEIAAWPRVTRIVACSVASDEARHAIEHCAKTLGAPVVWATSRAEQCGVKNGYDAPSQLGVDRWAALIGARHLHTAACLVVNAGTATTIDALDANGFFCGGIILPGLELMRTALARNTARLPLVAGDYRPLPRNTAQAIASGCLMATVGAIDRMFAGIAAQPGAICLLSGGAADNIAPLLDIPLRRIDNLVLEGLALIADAPQ